MPFASCSAQRARLIVFVTHSMLGVCISLFVWACGLVQQDSNTHVLLRGPSATCRPVCLSPWHPHVISELPACRSSSISRTHTLKLHPRWANRGISKQSQTLVVEHGSTVLCQLNVETKIKSQSLCMITDGVSICFSFLFLFYCTCFEEKPTDKGPHLEQQQKNKCKEEDQYVRMAFFCFSDRLLSSVYTNPKYSKATCKQLTDTYNWFC